MNRLSLILATTAAIAAASPAVASADTLLAAAPGGVDLTSGGGYQAWFAPNEDTGWRLTVRAPDGTVSQPQIDGFAGPHQVSIGSDTTDAAERRLLAVYARDNGDLYALDLRTGAEERVSRLSTRRYRESAPAVQYGSYVFVRRGGAKPGVYYAPRGRAARRISADTPVDLAYNGSRVAYARGNSIVVRRISGRGGTLVFRTASRPSSPALTRYRVAWLERATGKVLQTPRFAGSGGPYHVDHANEARRTLPGAQSIEMDGSSAGLFLDAEGVKRAAPPLFSTSGT